MRELNPSGDWSTRFQFYDNFVVLKFLEYICFKKVLLWISWSASRCQIGLLNNFCRKWVIHTPHCWRTDIDKLVSVKGMVIRCSSIIPEIKGAFFKCLVCGHSPPLLSVVKGKLIFQLHFSCISRASLVHLLVSYIKYTEQSDLKVIVTVVCVL